MPLFRQYKTENFGWGIWRMEESLNEIEIILDKSDYIQEARSRFSNPEKQREFLAVRLLLQTLLGSNKIVGYRESGKPYLLDGSYFISISHTKNYVAVLYHTSLEVGVDIERMSNRVLSLRHRFISPEDISAILPEQEPVASLLQWSAKEAVYKLLDWHALDFKEQMRILPFEVLPEGCFNMKVSYQQKKRDFQVNYFTHPDFVFTWCVTTP